MQNKHMLRGSRARGGIYRKKAVGGLPEMVRLAATCVRMAGRAALVAMVVSLEARTREAIATVM